MGSIMPSRLRSVVLIDIHERGGAMKKVLSVICLGALAALALALVVQTGCKAAKSDEIPITTKSKEARAAFLEARGLYEFYHLDKANALLKRAIELDPDFALAYLFFGITANDTPDFQKGLRRAFELAPKVTEGERMLIAGQQASFEERDAEKANRIYQELTALYPKDKRAHWYLAGTYGGLQQYDKQIASLEAAIALDATFAPVRENLGYVYRWLGQYDKAEAAFKEYGRLSPKEANSRDILGDLYMKMGRFEDAINEYGEAVRMDPSFAFSQQKAGSSLYFLGRYEDGRQAYLKAMELPYRASEKVYEQEGVMRGYLYEGDWAKALEAADKAIQMGYDLGLPEESTFLPYVKSNIYCEIGDFGKAEACVAEGLKALDAAALVDTIKENQRLTAIATGMLVAAGKKDFETALTKAASFREKVAAIKNPAMQKQADWVDAYVALAQGDASKALEYYGHGEVDEAWHLYYYALAKERAGDAAGAAELYKKVANWNLDGVWYPFVRQKAIDKLK
jgi:tetratricopeptide (TPR) repeat protein